ncbi:MAG: HNH endonuclease [Phycisphaerales bacterium]|nr:MAG: HNH endonuclease [Phycisphaerales bacterium]
MTKHRFSYCERYALWQAYDGRCFYCEKPLDFQDMTVDHILPERLSEDPLELRRLRQEYGIDDNFPGFQINDFTNRVPAHFRQCNLAKGSHILPKKMMLPLLEAVPRRLPKVREELDELSRRRGTGRLLDSRSAAIENKHLTVQEVRDFVAQVERSEHADEPLVLSFGLMIEDVLESEALPGDVAREYPHLCDWLELDLVKHLRTIITTPFHYTQPSERSGEGLSVRIVFPRLNEAEIEKFSLPWWEILEAATFWEIFGERYEDAFPDSPRREYFGQLGEEEPRDS